MWKLIFGKYKRKGDDLKIYIIWSVISLNNNTFMVLYIAVCSVIRMF